MSSSPNSPIITPKRRKQITLKIHKNHIRIIQNPSQNPKIKKNVSFNLQKNRLRLIAANPKVHTIRILPKVPTGEETPKSTRTEAQVPKKLKPPPVNGNNITKNRKRTIRRQKAKYAQRDDFNLKIMYTNPDGIGRKLPSIEAAAHALEVHIVAVAETKAKAKPNKIKGYRWKHLPREGKDGGGVAMAIREDILKVTRELKLLETQDQEVLWVELTLTRKKYYIGIYYGKQETEKKEVVIRVENSHNYKLKSNPLNKLAKYYSLEISMPN